MPSLIRGLAETISRAEAPAARQRFLDAAAARGLTASDEAVELAAALECAYPALAHVMTAHPDDVIAIARGTRVARDARTYRRQAAAMLGDMSDVDGVRRGLRLFAGREKLRIAARELLLEAGSDVDVTARELSDLAAVCIDLALTEALTWAEARYGQPRRSDGARCPFVVLGMGKLGGRELNAGSDVDLLLFYETDDGEVHKDGVATDLSLHELFTRVSQRLTSTMEEVTEDGMVWRVDLRLRPEGSRGPLVNSLAAAERYYETWGRTWERAALVRARAVAGDIAFGEEVLAALGPFVWRREVNPNLADEMIGLVDRARNELASVPERDLKLGSGGIREAEFFVQSLQLIWGGREPTVRSTNTLDALRRLRARGLVTDREGRELADAYLVLRRLEHRVQFATGLQTHTLPPRDADGGLLERIARSLGFSGGAELEKDLDKTRRRVAARLASLSRQSRAAAEGAGAALPGSLARLYLALEAGDETLVQTWLPTAFGASASPDLARHLLALARRPDFPLGASSRDKFPELAAVLVEALSDAADPEQATRLMAAFFARLSTPSVYAKALAEDPRAARRIAGLFGASAFLGESLAGHPELFDRLLFGRGAPTEESARRAVDEEIAALPRDADGEDFVGALRRAKRRVTMEVGLADLAGELSTRGCTLTLSALADASLDHATRFALHERGMVESGLAVIAMGKLGGREIGYGSDLDIFFVYDDAAGADVDAAERFVRTAQRVMRLVSAPHGDGPGYELDTRLRPSGNQGLLVVSVDAFARYHGVRSEKPAEDWERQALLKARACAGDRALGQRVLAIAHAAAYERGAPPPERIHHLRMRMERELAGERTALGRARYDLKLGRGGLVDVEFAVQWLQMKHGADPRVRSADTETALGALEACGYLDAPLAMPLREGYRLLRRLEQRLRVLHGTSAQLIEEGAPGMTLLARRMGMRDGPRGSAVEALFARYAAVTRDVRAAYGAVLGLAIA
jgi:glutamate-ammonia-ligase adenylyltransferase